VREALDLIRRPANSKARVARASIAYAAASVTQRAVGLLMLPIYVRVVGSAEYGQLAVATTIASAASTVLSFGLETAIFRGYIHFGSDPAERERFVNTVGIFLIAVPTVLVVVLGFVMVMPLSSFFAIRPEAIALALAGVAITVPATILPMALLRAQERLADYLRVSVATVIAQTVLMLVLVVVLHAGLDGWLLASLLAAAVQLTVGLILLRHRWTRAFDAALLWGALAFGLPLIPHALSHWALALSDRAILGAYVGASQIGIYNLAYQLAVPMGMLTVAMNQGIMPIYAEATHDSTRRRELGGLASRQFVLTCLLGLTVALLGPPTIRIVMPDEFDSAANLLPWIAAGYTFFGLYLLPMNAVAVMAGKTRWVWTSTVAAGIVNITLNLITIPTFGTTAAAVNTAIAYAVLLLLLLAYQYRVARAPISLVWRRIVIALAVMGIGLLLAVVLLPDASAPLVSFLGRSVLLVIVAIVLWATLLRRGSVAAGAAT
jgi:O-antigen/teichoic acid export membrane protein